MWKNVQNEVRTVVNSGFIVISRFIKISSLVFEGTFTDENLLSMHVFNLKSLGDYRGGDPKKAAFICTKKLIKFRSRKKINTQFAEITPIFITNMSLGQN